MKKKLSTVLIISILLIIVIFSFALVSKYKKEAKRIVHKLLGSPPSMYNPSYGPIPGADPPDMPNIGGKRRSDAPTFTTPQPIESPLEIILFQSPHDGSITAHITCAVCTEDQDIKIEVLEGGALVRGRKESFIGYKKGEKNKITINRSGRSNKIRAKVSIHVGDPPITFRDFSTLYLDNREKPEYRMRQKARIILDRHKKRVLSLPEKK